MPGKSADADPLQDLRTAARGLSDSAEAEIAELRRKVEQLLDQRVSPIVTHVTETAGTAAREAADRVRRNADDLVEQVRARPVTSLGLALAAGFLLASLMRR
jgi:ElaB/YqjD/DUF883 family membrane-anchored ribosome-binding protein